MRPRLRLPTQPLDADQFFCESDYSVTVSGHSSGVNGLNLQKFRCSEEPSIPFGATRITGLTPLLVGTNSADFTVFAATTATDRQSLPATFTPLYAINYPAPLAGTYWTTSLPDCTTLNQQWQGRNTCDSTDVYVLRARSGACPIGASSVYRLYQPKVIAHRYTQSAEAYAALIDVGYTGEGVVWCAPVHN